MKVDVLHFGGTYIKIGTIQRRLAWPLRKDDTQIREAFQIFKRMSLTKHLNTHTDAYKYACELQSDVYDHTTMNTPVLVRSRKLSIVGPG